MICKQCGQEIKQGERFCASCGAMVETTDVKESVALAKKPVNVAKIVGIASVAVVALLVVLLLSMAFGSSYDEPIDNIVEVLNDQETDIDKIAKSLLPGKTADAYTKMMKVLEGSDAYGDDIKDIKDELPDVMTDLYEDLYDLLEDEYGKKPKFKYEIKDKEKIDKDDREEISDAYKDLADIAPGIISCVKSLEECTDLEDKEIDELVEIIEDLEEEFSELKVSSGYILELEVYIEGKDDKSDEEDIDIVVIKANGDWMLDILSTTAINSDMDIDEVTDLVKELEVDEMSDQLKDVAEGLEEMDEDVMELLIEKFEDVIDNVEGIKDISKFL